MCLFSHFSPHFLLTLGLQQLLWLRSPKGHQTDLSFVSQAGCY